MSVCPGGLAGDRDLRPRRSQSPAAPAMPSVGTPGEPPLAPKAHTVPKQYADTNHSQAARNDDSIPCHFITSFRSSPACKASWPSVLSAHAARSRSAPGIAPALPLRPPVGSRCQWLSSDAKMAAAHTLHDSRCRFSHSLSSHARFTHSSQLHLVHSCRY